MSPHPAVMIVDVQAAFSPPAPFVEKISQYIRPFPCRIFTRYINPPGSLFRRALKQNSCAPGSPDCELLIKPESGDLVFDKEAKYGLSADDVGQLKRRGIERVTVCGLDTDACVLGVMFTLFDGGI